MSHAVTLDRQVFWTPVTTRSEIAPATRPPRCNAAIFQQSSAQASQGHPPTKQAALSNEVILIPSDAESDMDDSDEDGANHGQRTDTARASSVDSLPPISVIIASINEKKDDQILGLEDLEKAFRAANKAGDSPSAASSAEDQSSHASIPLSCSPNGDTSLSQSAPSTPPTSASQQDTATPQQITSTQHLDCVRSTGNSIPPSPERTQGAVSSHECDTTHNGSADAGHSDAMAPCDSMPDNEADGNLSLYQEKTHDLSVSSPGQETPKYQVTPAEVNEQHSPHTEDLSHATPSDSSRTIVKEPQHGLNTMITGLARSSGNRQGKVHDPLTRRSKRTRPLAAKQDAVGGEGDDSSDEYAPSRKRRRVAALAGKKSNERDCQSGRRTRPRAVKTPQNEGSNEHLPMEKTRPITTARYEEWKLPDAVLKCLQDSETATFQLQFTWDVACDLHAPREQPLAGTRLKPVKLRRSQGDVSQVKRTTRNSCPQDLTETDGEQQQLGLPAGVYLVERILARWEKHTFLIKWAGYSATTWEPRKHVKKKMLREFERAFQGFDDGVDVLDMQTRDDKRQVLLHWHGRPTGEDTWVDESLMSPERMERIGTEMNATCV
ncbi:hypothetical protein TOPH_06225 [Tolypocladium ophioglossoides CBS 100239]|uniref:Chromo domain-containing protein n=1 Tax=Tolypocladium ophioglossoides (strain CBS 100239) TaxID=1163406 RepID=A0A0L0N5B3_TOLOC|nr:hypothetical protein TOPH_06225 [Tolypocladium ophioglossoides CBS 100239]